MLMDSDDEEVLAALLEEEGIYPRWSTFVKTIKNPVPGGKNAWFAKIQEACR